MPVGTADQGARGIARSHDERGLPTSSFDVVSNPEFLKEGAAIDDFMRPARIVIGADIRDSAELLRRLYAPFNRNHDRLI